MAGGTYQIFVVLDATGATNAIRALKGELSQVKTTAKETDDVFRGLFKFFAIGEIVSGLHQAVDSFLAVKSAIQVAGSSGEETYQVFNKLLDIADQTRTPIETLADLYRNLSLYSKSLGASQDDLLKVTKEVGEAIALQGGSSTRAQNGILQLAKALEEGKIQGQTFNALLKDLGPLFGAISTQSGLSAIDLRHMAQAGTLTSASLFDLIKKAEPILQKRFEQSVVTLGQAFVVMRNNLVGAVADIDHATGGFSLFAGAVVDIAKSIRTLGPLILNLGITLVALRVGFAGFASTATTAGAASLVFGKSVLGAKGAVDVFKLSFAGTVTLLVTVATLMLQFGDRVKISIGPIQNLHDLMLATGTVLGIFINRVLGARTAGLLFVGFLISARTGLGAYGIAITTVVAALVRFHASMSTSVIVLSGLAVTLLAIRATFNTTGTAAKILDGIITGMGIGVRALRDGYFALTGAELAADAAAAPLAVTYAAVAIAVGLVTAAIVYLLLQIPGVNALVTALANLALVAWDFVIDKVHRLYEAIKQLIELIPGVTTLEAAINKFANAQWDKAVKGADSAKDALSKLWEELKKAIEQTLNLDKALKGAGDAGNQAAGGFNEAAKGADKLANSAANAAHQLEKLKEAQVAASGGNGGFTQPTVAGNGNFAAPPGAKSDAGFSDAANQADQAFRDKVFTSGTDNGAFFPPGTATNTIADKLFPNGIGSGTWQPSTLTADEMAQAVIGGVEAQAKAAKKAQEQADKLAADQQKAAAQAQADAAKLQEEVAKANAIQQAKDQSLEQLTLQALNAFGVTSASQLPGNVSSLIGNISNLQGNLAGQTDPIQRAETGRQIQILTDALKQLTDAVTATTDDNPYLKYAQNVYGDLVGIQGKVVAAAAAATTAAGGAAAILSGTAHSGGGSSSSSSSGFSPGLLGSGPGSHLYLGAFADGGSVDIGNTGRYTADLHSGETVTVTRKDAPAAKVININMNVNGVQDVDGFRRSRKQILATLYRDLMAVGEQT